MKDEIEEARLHVYTMEYGYPQVLKNRPLKSRNLESLRIFQVLQQNRDDIHRNASCVYFLERTQFDEVREMFGLEKFVRFEKLFLELNVGISGYLEFVELPLE